MTAPLLFLACHPADADVCTELEKRLVPPRRQGLLRFASSRSLRFDRAAIRATIAEAHTVAFLLTNDYARSGDGGTDGECVEMSRAATITIAAKPLDGHIASCWLPQGRADLPRNGRPITRWPDKDEALAEIAEGLLEAVAPKAPPASPLNPELCPTCHQALPRRDTPVSWAKLLREMAKNCANPDSARRAAFERAAEVAEDISKAVALAQEPLAALGAIKLPDYGEHVAGSHLDTGGFTKADVAGCPGGGAYDSEHVEGSVCLYGKRPEPRP